jgi:hypothetical protein
MDILVNGDVVFIISLLSSSLLTYFNAIVASPLSQRYYSSHRLSPKPQIDFDSRLGIHDVGNDCLMSVDGTDFCIPQNGAAKKGNPFWSHKYVGKSTLCYELGVDSLMGNLVWIQGPYPAKAWPDIKIFTSCLAHFLEPYGRVEADNGYQGHADKVKCPKNDVNPVKNLKMQGHIRARHKTLNGHLKNWGILSQVFRHVIRCHRDVFRACAVITQLTIKHGEPLFMVEYGD